MFLTPKHLSFDLKAEETPLIILLLHQMSALG